MTAGSFHTFVEQEVAFLHNVFVKGVFCFPPDSVINFSAIHCVSKNLLLVLQPVKKKTSGLMTGCVQHTTANWVGSTYLY